jgi:2-C-methyl-D-erythritol 2,4-cyclodiphosphate synthase
MTADFRVGIGHDTHRLVDGGPLRLGGIDIQFDQRLEGHSDADVLLHAITDALLGAACLGDIGEMFPNTDPKNKGRDSAEMLSAAADRVISLGWKIANIDCIVHAEAPKISNYRDKIQQRISDLLVLRPDQISLKGKTGEGVGVVGERLAIQAQCVCLLQRIERAKGEYGGIGF